MADSLFTKTEKQFFIRGNGLALLFYRHSYVSIAFAASLNFPPEGCGGGG